MKDSFLATYFHILPSLDIILFQSFFIHIIYTIIYVYNHTIYIYIYIIISQEPLIHWILPMCNLGVPWLPCFEDVPLLPYTVAVIAANLVVTTGVCILGVWISELRGGGNNLALVNFVN